MAKIEGVLEQIRKGHHNLYQQDQNHNHLWIHTDYDYTDRILHNDLVLLKVSGSLQYQKLFVSLQRLHHLEFFLYFQLY